MTSDKHTGTDSDAGTLYLIPAPLGKDPVNRVLPEHVISVVHSLDAFFVERIRQANSYLRWLKHPVPDYKCRFYELNKHTPGEDLLEMLSVLKNGVNAGIISEAGCPAVADPGSELVRLAHESGIRVVPLTGPSSVLLALMASGLNGQSFTFHGYLPKPGRERTEKIRHLQTESARKNITQIFMETPFRNNQLLEELRTELDPDTLLSAGVNLTLPEEQIITRRISDWKSETIDIDNKPAIFLILAEKKGTSRPAFSGAQKKKKPAHKRKRVKK